MTGEQESDRCYFCGGSLRSGMATIPFVVGSTVVVVKRVPALVCAQCGETIMDSAVAATIDHLLKQALRSGFEMSVVSYDEIAMVAA